MNSIDRLYNYMMINNDSNNNSIVNDPMMNNPMMNNPMMNNQMMNNSMMNNSMMNNPMMNNQTMNNQMMNNSMMNNNIQLNLNYPFFNNNMMMSQLFHFNNFFPNMNMMHFPNSYPFMNNMMNLNNINFIDINGTNNNYNQNHNENKLKKQFIKELDEYQYKNKDKFEKAIIEDECSICLCKYKITDILKILPCQHGFHKKCIKKWLSNDEHNKCPLCNFDIKAEVNKRKADLEKHIVDDENKYN